MTRRVVTVALADSDNDARSELALTILALRAYADSVAWTPAPSAVDLALMPRTYDTVTGIADRIESTLEALKAKERAAIDAARKAERAAARKSSTSAAASPTVTPQDAPPGPGRTP